MSKLLPLHCELGGLVTSQRPSLAGSRSRQTGGGSMLAGGGSRQTGGGSRQTGGGSRQTGGGSRQTAGGSRQTAGGSRPLWSHIHRSRRPVLEDVEPSIHRRLVDIRSALQAADPAGTGLLSKDDLTQVLKSQLRLSPKQLDTVISEMCGGSGATVDYMQLVRRLRRAPVACRVRHVQQNSSMSLSEIQKHLKQKIGGNLRTMIRVFRLFDYNRQGLVEQHDFRRILDNYCIQLTDKEFQRVWHHYSPSSMATLSYELFLDELGFGDTCNFNIAPVCTKLAMSSRGTTPRGRVHHKEQRAECEAPSLLPQRNLHTLFYDKLCVNSTPVWRALQASDSTRSGLVTWQVLRDVLSSFIFPMNPHTFQKLTSRYGVRETGPVRWKHFLGHFIHRVKEESNTQLHTDRACEQPPPDDGNMDLWNIYPQLKQTFPLLDMETGAVTRADVSRLLQRPGGTQPHLPRSQITEILRILDPDHTGIIQLGRLKTLNPFITASPTGNTAAPPSPDSAAGPPGPPSESRGTPTESKEHKTGDERESTQWADKVCVASASQRTLDQQLSSALAALQMYDRCGHVTQEDDRTISDTHLNRPSTAPQSTLPSLTEHRPPSSLQVDPELPDILGLVFHRMRLRLEEQHNTLTDRVQAVVHSSDTVHLSETDVQKILEDSWVVLDNENFNRFTQSLGFTDGRIERSLFQAKYDESTARAAGQQEPGEAELLTSAEQCLAALKTRINTIHGNNLTAFRLMDRRHKGVADCSDFRVLFNTLGFLCTEQEYERLLDLIDLRPGGNLNYADFVKVVENNGNRGTQKATVQEQLHELLAHEARYKWADMSKALCQFDNQGQARIDKKSLKKLLFTYALPLTSTEFEQLWSRYDPEGLGSVAVCDFLEKLGFHHEGELRSQSWKLSRTALRPATSDTPSVERNQLKSPMDYVSCANILSAFNPGAEKWSGPPPASPDTVRHIQSLDGLSPGMAVSRMQKLVTASASNLYKAFSAFDQSGTGTVKALEFRQVLESFCAHLSDKQFRYMLTELELDCDTSTVNWKEFLNKFRNPLIPGYVNKITEELMDSNSSTISKEQFRQRCDRHHLSLTNDQFERLWRQMPVTEQSHWRKLEHGEFLRWTLQMPASSPEPRGTTSATQPDTTPDTPGGTFLRMKCSHRRPASVGGPGTGSPLGKMESRLRAAVQHRWKEIQRKCAQEDPQQEGHISTASFLEVLGDINITMTQEQLQSLAVKLDFVNNGCVSYHNFLRHFLLNLQPAETTRAFERRKLPLPLTQASQAVLSRDGVDVMLRTYDVVRSSWTSIRRSFLTADRTHTGFVTVQDFRKVLCLYRVNLSEEDFFHLSSYFDAKATGKICYNSFLWAFLR